MGATILIVLLVVISFSYAIGKDATSREIVLGIDSDQIEVYWAFVARNPNIFSAVALKTVVVEQKSSTDFDLDVVPGCMKFLHQFKQLGIDTYSILSLESPLNTAAYESLFNQSDEFAKIASEILFDYAFDGYNLQFNIPTDNNNAHPSDAALVHKFASAIAGKITGIGSFDLSFTRSSFLYDMPIISDKSIPDHIQHFIDQDTATYNTTLLTSLIQNGTKTFGNDGTRYTPALYPATDPMGLNSDQLCSAVNANFKILKDEFSSSINSLYINAEGFLLLDQSLRSCWLSALSDFVN